MLDYLPYIPKQVPQGKLYNYLLILAKLLAVLLLECIVTFRVHWFTQERNVGGWGEKPTTASFSFHQIFIEGNHLQFQSWRILMLHEIDFHSHWTQIGLYLIRRDFYGAPLVWFERTFRRLMLEGSSCKSLCLPSYEMYIYNIRSRRRQHVSKTLRHSFVWHREDVDEGEAMPHYIMPIKCELYLAS